MDESLTWVVRFGHVLSAAIWVGGYACLAVILSVLPRGRGSVDTRAIVNLAARLLNVAGTSTVLFGLALIWRTRGFGQVGRGEWGLIVLMSILIAVGMMGVGDGALRSWLRRPGADSDLSPAQRVAVLGLALGVVAIALMTRALYAGS